MEIYSGSSISLEKIAFNNYIGYELDTMKREHPAVHRAAVSPREVICPQPRRIARPGYLFDSLELCCTTKSNLPAPHSKESSLDIISRLLSKDDVEDDIDDSRVQIGLFCGTPPVRTNNPLIHDTQFVRHQAPVLASPLESVGGAKGSSTRVERVSSCGTSTFAGKPLVRIEGFSCGSSKSHCIVPAFA